MNFRTLVFAISLVTMCPAFANDTQVEKTIAETISKAFSFPVEKVTKSGYGELYELLTPEGIAYTDKTASFMIFGSVVINTKTKENLTQKRTAEISKFNWKDLPLKDAIRMVNGNGKRVIATIEDPNCGYCKKLIPNLAQLKDVTIYTFLAPVLGEDSVKKSRQIWCSSDHAKTWVSWMKDGAELPAAQECETPLERNTMLTKKLRVMGTPAILFEDGDRIPGFTTTEKIEEKLAKLKESKK